VKLVFASSKLMPLLDDPPIFGNFFNSRADTLVKVEIVKKIKIANVLNALLIFII
jgi:hypothetical protein